MAVPLRFTYRGCRRRCLRTWAWRPPTVGASGRPGSWAVAAAVIVAGHHPSGASWTESRVDSSWPLIEEDKNGDQNALRTRLWGGLMLIFSPSASTPWSTHRVFFLSFFCCSPKPVCGEGRKLVCTTISNVLVITVTDRSFLLLPFWFGEEGQTIDSCISPRYSKHSCFLFTATTTNRTGPQKEKMPSTCIYYRIVEQKSLLYTEKERDIEMKGK